MLFMKKLVGFLSLALVLTFSASAQEQAHKYKVSVGGEFLYPLGGLAAEFYAGGYGASLQGEYKLTPKLNATVSGGYMSLAVSKLYKAIYLPWKVELSDQVFYPVKAGVKYSLHKSLYVAGEAGASISKNKSVRATSFVYAGGVGTAFNLSPKSSIDLGVRYEAWALNSNNTYSFAGIRAAYVFGF